MTQALVILKSEKLVQKFDDVAPSWIKYEAEQGFALQHLENNSYLKKIAEGSPQSLLFAMSNVAACGLSLNPASKEAYLVPRKGQICFDPSYMGLAKLATDTGSILWVECKLVHANDEFVMNGTGLAPTHKFSPFGDRGEYVGVYCVAKVHDGSFLTEAMSIDEVYAIRNRSESYKSNPNKTPWASDAGEMIKKTVVKRASKLWPRSDNHAAEQRLAIAVQSSFENEEVELVTTTPDLGQVTDQQKEFFDQLISDDEALEMYVLQRTLSSSEFSNLYHSFGKGEKGKYQRIVDELTTKGRGQFEEYIVLLQQGHDVEAEVSTEAFELIKEQSN